LGNPLLKIDDFALDLLIFLRAMAFAMRGYKSISCVSILHTKGYAVHPLLQCETRGWKLLPGTSKTPWYAEPVGECLDVVVTD
jgi:hypothetical protein